MSNMADDNRSRSKEKPPPHIESYLTAKEACPSVKIKARKSYYCVLYGNLIQCFGSERSYTEKRENVKAQVDLDLVRSISETISLPASRQKQEYCFKLVFHNDNELDFIAQSNEAVKKWVECVTQTKKFWELWEQNEQFEVNKDEHNSKETNQGTALKVTDEERDPHLMKVPIKMSHGQPYTAYVPPDGTLDDLWTAVLKSLPGHFCFKCNTCQLRGSTMELWSVTNDGAAYKVEKHFNVEEYFTTSASNPIYLLEHNFKLLVVYFEDSSFLVSPVDISKKAGDIPRMELFSRKLSEIECSNAQLYLKTSSGTVTPFSQEDAPLRTLWELHGDKWALKPREGEKFLLKSKAILKNNPENTSSEKIQQKKLKTKICERRQKEVLRKIEIHGCKPNMMKNLFPAAKALPFEASLTSTSDMNEDHFSNESDNKTKHQIEHCKFVPSPVNTATGQLSAPFCPPDNFDFTPKPNKEPYDSQEVTVRRQRSMTDITQYRTGDNNEGSVTEAMLYRVESDNEVNRRASDSGSLTRKGAFRRKSSRDSLYSSTSCGNEIEFPDTATDQSHGLSYDSYEEGLTHEKNTGEVSKKSQQVTEVSSYKTEDEHNEGTSRVQFDKCDQDDDEAKGEDQTYSCLTNQQDIQKLEKMNETLLSSANIIGNDVEKDVHSDSGIDSFDGTIKNEVRLPECNEHLHSCDYYDVKTPYFLKNILDQYSRLSAGEEEVGVDPPPQGICLSSIHLLHVEGCWVVQTDVELDEDDSETSKHEDYETFKLPGDIKVLFNRNKRTWVVKRIKVDPNEQVDLTTPVAVEVVVPESSNDQLSNGNALSDNPPNENPCSMEKTPANENPCFMEKTPANDNPCSKEEIPANENPCSMEEKEDNSRSSTWKSNFHPLTINNCGQHFAPLDDSYELNNDDQPSTAAHDFTEIRILEDTIQKLFYHMEKHQDLSAAECLDDRRFPAVRKLVCIELCTALNNIVSHGLKKKYTLLSAIRYSIWEVVKGTSTNDVTSALVKKINAVGALDDKTRFELFVCECLNQKSGALASWVEALQNNKKKLNMYYDVNALVMKLPKDTLEKLVSRITFLPFNISFYQHVYKKMKEARNVTQFAFE